MAQACYGNATCGWGEAAGVQNRNYEVIELINRCARCGCYSTYSGKGVCHISKLHWLDAWQLAVTKI